MQLHGILNEAALLAGIPIMHLNWFVSRTLSQDSVTHNDDSGT